METGDRRGAEKTFGTLRKGMKLLKAPIASIHRVSSVPAKRIGRPPGKALNTIPGTVSYVALSLPGGKATFMEYARWSDDEKVRTMLEVWDEGTEKERNQINLDELCKEVGIPGPELVGIVATQAMAHNRHAATILSAAAIPSVVKTNIQEARKPEGMFDRKMFLEHTGILPTKSGIAINNQILNAAGAMGGAPSEIFRTTINRGADLAREEEE